MFVNNPRPRFLSITLVFLELIEFELRLILMPSHLTYLEQCRSEEVKQIETSHVGMSQPQLSIHSYPSAEWKYLQFKTKRYAKILRQFVRENIQSTLADTNFFFRFAFDQLKENEVQRLQCV